MVVTRFAPSPTGFMHVGNLRTALYAYLIARANGGKFILRIEDTDQERFVDGAIELIYKTLKDAGIEYDEGPDIGGPSAPYVQSQRKEIYKKYAEMLVEKGGAYYCFCTKERLENLKSEEGAFEYDRHCRNLSKEEVEKKLKNGVPYVIRQKMPTEGETCFDDLVFGHVSVKNQELQDIILLKSDGLPTYNFAHVVDDHLMGVTHVVRGSEYIASSPKHVLLYDAFGWERPKYVHLPLLMGKNEDGSFSKLSKRHGAVSFQDLTDEGYLPQAIINYIAFLGWKSKQTTEEFFSLDELKKLFKIEEINKSPSVFDYEKLNWFNKAYILNMPFEEFKTLVQKYLPNQLKGEKQDKILSLIKPRIEKLADIEEVTQIFIHSRGFDAALFENKKNKTSAEQAKQILPVVQECLQSQENFSNDALFTSLSKLAEQLNIKVGALMWIVRIALTFTQATPGGATEILEVLGKDESLKRIEAAIKNL